MRWRHSCESSVFELVIDHAPKRRTYSWCWSAFATNSCLAECHSACTGRRFWLCMYFLTLGGCCFHTLGGVGASEVMALHSVRVLWVIIVVCPSSSSIIFGWWPLRLTNVGVSAIHSGKGASLSAYSGASEGAEAGLSSEVMAEKIVDKVLIAAIWVSTMLDKGACVG